MKMLLLQMLVAIFAVVTLVWGLLCIKKSLAKIILIASSLFICLFGYIGFLNYENIKSNIIECYKLNGCQNNFSADFIINYEKNILTKKIEDQIFAKTNNADNVDNADNAGNVGNAGTSTTDRPEIKHDIIDQKPIEEIKMNEVKTDKEKLQSIKNR